MKLRTLCAIALLLISCVGVSGQGTTTPPNAVIVNKQTGTTYTLTSLDRGRLVTLTNVASIAVTLAAKPSGWYCYVENRGAGTVTITTVTVTIDGGASLTLATNQGVLIASDGANFFTGNRGRMVIAAGDLPTGIDAAKIANGSVSNTEFQYLDGATSAIQTQIDGKQPLDSDLTDIAGLSATTDNFMVAVSSHWASRTVAQVKTTLSLSSVTNDAQTKAAVVPNTAPTAGQLLIGNAGGTAYAPLALSQDCTLASTGVLTCLKTNNVSFGTAATQNTGTSGATIPLLNGANTYSGVQTYGKAMITPSNSLTDNGSTIATDASLGNNFRVTALTANVTLSNPTNSVDGQRVVWEVIQHASAAKTLAFDTNFKFGAEITACTISSTTSTHNFITAVYNSTTTKWYVVGCLTGY